MPHPLGMMPHPPPPLLSHLTPQHPSLQNRDLMSSFPLPRALLQMYKASPCTSDCLHSVPFHAGQFVARIQKVRGVEFSYQPPPRNIVPYAAALKGQHPRWAPFLPLLQPLEAVMVI